MSLSENIRKIRQKALLNQESFAEALNVKLITVHRWESGKSLPNLTAMRALKDFCSRHDFSYSVLENDWLAERLSKTGERLGGKREEP